MRGSSSGSVDPEASRVTTSPSSTVCGLPAEAVGASLSALTVMVTVEVEVTPSLSVRGDLEGEVGVGELVGGGEGRLHRAGVAEYATAGSTGLGPGVGEGLVLGVGGAGGVEGDDVALVDVCGLPAEAVGCIVVGIDGDGDGGARGDALAVRGR